MKTITTQANALIPMLLANIVEQFYHRDSRFFSIKHQSVPASKLRRIFGCKERCYRFVVVSRIVSNGECHGRSRGEKGERVIHQLTPLRWPFDGLPVLVGPA